MKLIFRFILCFRKVFNTSDWLRDTSEWSLDDDGNPIWPGPQDPGDAVNGQNQTECFFKGLTTSEYPYKHSWPWWHVFAARLAFVLCFQVIYIKATQITSFVFQFTELLTYTILFQMRFHQNFVARHIRYRWTDYGSNT